MTNSLWQGSSPRLLVLAAFGMIYFVWGGVYLAISFAIATIPPFIMTGSRLLAAGALLYGWARWRGAPKPTLAEWCGTAIVGVFIMFAGVGVSTWAQQWVPSGLTGVLIGSMPVWMVLMDWGLGGPRPTGRVATGLLLGLAGIVLIVQPETLVFEVAPTRIFGMAMMVVAALGWAAGSLAAIRARLPNSVLLATAMQMLVGGSIVLATAILSGEVAHFDGRAVSLESVLSIAYLVIFPGILAFSAYNWLLRVTTPVQVATFRYVNPVVALVLGWAIGGEELSPRTLAASAISLAGVALIMTAQTGSPRREAEEGARSPPG